MSYAVIVALILFALVLAAGIDEALIRSERKSKKQEAVPMITVSRFTLSRVFRFVNETGAAQITDFPEDAPDGSSDLEVRMKHFTEIENFSFLGYVLAHELEHGAPGAPISTLADLDVPDPEFKARVAEAQTEMISNEQLGDIILDFGINWEHFVATFNTSLIADNPLVITDTVIQRKIDSLDLITEALVREVNRRSQAFANTNPVMLRPPRFETSSTKS